MKKLLIKILAVILGIIVAYFTFLIIDFVVSEYLGDNDFSSIGAILYFVSLVGCLWLGILAGNMLYYKFYPKAEKSGILKLTPKNKYPKDIIKLTEEQLTFLSDKERKEYESITADGFTTHAPASAVILGTWYESKKYKKRVEKLRQKAINAYDDKVGGINSRIKK